MNRMLAGLLVAVWFSTALAQDQAGDSPIDPASRRAIIGQPAGPVLSGEALDRKSAEVSALLRCPVCQGLSIADSPASMAVNMRREVRDLLAEGYSGDQVLAYFEKSYGEFVRLQPQFRGFNWLVWLAPVAALLVGVFVVMRFVRPVAHVDLDVRGVVEDHPSVDPYLDQVRRLAYLKDEGKTGHLDGPARGNQ